MLADKHFLHSNRQSWKPEDQLLNFIYQQKRLKKLLKREIKPDCVCVFFVFVFDCFDDDTDPGTPDEMFPKCV